MPHLWQICSYIHMMLNNPKFNDYIVIILYQEELKIKDTTCAPQWANYLDIHLGFDDLMMVIFTHDKRDDIVLPIVN